MEKNKIKFYKNNRKLPLNQGNWSLTVGITNYTCNYN